MQIVRARSARIVEVLWAAGRRSVWRTAGSRAVNRTISAKRMKCERERHIVRNVDESTVNLPLHDNAANVPASRNRALIKCRDLPGFPREQQVAALDFALLPQQRKRPCFVTAPRGLNSDDSLHGIDTFGH